MSNFSIDSVYTALSKGLEEQGNKLADMVENADPSDMTQMMKVQMQESKYELYIKLGSSLTADLKNAVSSICQKN